MWGNGFGRGMGGQGAGSPAFQGTTTREEIAYGNIFGAIFIDIPRGCCGKVSVRNISTIPVSVQNANLIVERVA